MATNPLNQGGLPFKIPAGLDALKAKDAEFWRLHAVWRLAEDELESYPGFPDEDPHAELLMQRWRASRAAMFLAPVRSAAALSMKLEVCQEGDPSAVVEWELRAGIKVFDVIRWDCERIAKVEMFGADAFEDTAEG